MDIAGSIETKCGSHRIGSVHLGMQHTRNVFTQNAVHYNIIMPALFWMEQRP